MAAKQRGQVLGQRELQISLPLTTQNASHLRTTYNVMAGLRERFEAHPGEKFMLDMRYCPKIDAGGTLMLKSTLDRGNLEHRVEYDLRWPHQRSVRFAVSAIGFSGARQHRLVREAQKAAREGLTSPTPDDDDSGSGTLQIISGAKGEATGAQTFEAAKLAEQMGDPVLSDKVHAALNEAADNVISWAYDGSHLPLQAQRWWAMGLFSRTEPSIFIALDYGATIPATAPRKLSDKIEYYVSLLRKQGKKVFSPILSDEEVLQATISYKRSQSGKGERGKGLADMIGLIDRLESGEILIVSGDALFFYRRVLGEAKPFEVCRSLGWRFEGTMIVWFVGGSSKVKA